MGYLFQYPFPIPSGPLVNSFFDLQLKLIHFYFPFPAVFWGDIALDEEDLKLFHIDKAHDWVKQSVEDMGHSTGKYGIPSTPSVEGRAGDSDTGRC